MLFSSQNRNIYSQYQENTISTKTIDYCANFGSVDGNLEYILMPEGRILVEGTTYKYEYHLKDHLGNTRTVFVDLDNDGDIETANSEVTQVADYYPFGMKHANASLPNDATQRYLYNGKELQEGTDWYYYGNRFYDPAKPGWLTIDRKAEKYYSISPYVYAIDNPIRFIDPDGNVIVDATNNPITYTAENGWSPNATPDAMRIGNAMMLTPVGNEMFNKLSDASYNVTFSVSGADGGGNLGQMTPTYNSNGDLVKADIVIFEKVIANQVEKFTEVKTALDNNPGSTANTNEKGHALLDNLPTVVERIGQVGVHEGEHTTNKEAQAEYNSNFEEREKLADKKEIEAIKQTPEYRLKEVEPKSAFVTTY